MRKQLNNGILDSKTAIAIEELSALNVMRKECTKLWNGHRRDHLTIGTLHSTQTKLRP